jgi:hypothetical protein
MEGSLWPADGVYYDVCDTAASSAIFIDIKMARYSFKKDIIDLLL